MHQSWKPGMGKHSGTQGDVHQLIDPMLIGGSFLFYIQNRLPVGEVAKGVCV